MTVKIEPLAEATYDRRMAWVNEERKAPIYEVNGVAVCTRKGKPLLIPDSWAAASEAGEPGWGYKVVHVPEDIDAVRIGDPV